MKLLLSLALVFSVVLLSAQTKPSNFTEETNPNNSNFEFYSQKNDEPRRATFNNMKKNMVPDVNTTPIAYVPTSTGNASNRTQFVQTAGDSIYYIDGYGDAFLLYDPTDTVLTGSISGDTLFVNNLELLLSPYRQAIDTLELDGTTLKVSLSGDNQAASEVDLSSLSGGGSALTAGSLISLAGDSISLASGVMSDNISVVTGSYFFNVVTGGGLAPQIGAGFGNISIGSFFNNIVSTDTVMTLTLGTSSPTSGEFVINDTRTGTGAKQGITYAADYSASFVARSLVDKAYVDKDNLMPEASVSMTAELYHIALVDATSATAIVTPPSSPSAGDWFAVSDSRGNAGNNNITIDFSAFGDLLHGSANNYIMNVNYDFVRFTYVNATVGWIKSN